MNLKVYLELEFSDLVVDGKDLPMDYEELEFILDSIFADNIEVGNFINRYGFLPSIKAIIKLLDDQETRNELISYGEACYNDNYFAKVGNREYTATKAYYDGISDPDEVDYGDGYPVYVYDIPFAKAVKDTDFGMHIVR